MLALKLSRASLSMVSSSAMDNVHRNGHEMMRNRKNRGGVEVPERTEVAMMCSAIIIFFFIFIFIFISSSSFFCSVFFLFSSLMHAHV